MSHAEMEQNFRLGGQEPGAFFEGTQRMDIIPLLVKDPTKSIRCERSRRKKPPGPAGEFVGAVELIEVIAVKAGEIVEGGMRIRVQRENSFIGVGGGGVIRLCLP